MDRGALTAIVAAGVNWWEHALLSGVDPGTLAVIVPGMILGLLGGMAAAIVPWGRDPRWGWAPAMKSMLLGVIAGTIASLFLAGVTWVNEWTRLGFVAVVGYLAQRAFDELDQATPRTLRAVVRWIMRRPPVDTGGPPSA